MRIMLRHLTSTMTSTRFGWTTEKINHLHVIRGNIETQFHKFCKADKVTNQLHQLYEPKELKILNLILETKPKKPLSAYSWFLTKEYQGVGSQEARERWLNMESDKKLFYNHCALLDKKRFRYEKSSWLTKLISKDLNSDNLALEDFDTDRVKDDLDRMISIIEIRKDILPKIVQRPMSTFSLFIRAYREQTKHLKFRFGKHLRDSAAAWAKLSEEEKQVYRDESKKLKSHNKIQSNSTDDCQANKLSIDFFKHSKKIFGPTRPEHLLTRVPTLLELYGQANKLKAKDRAAAWESLPNSAKKEYIEKLENMRNIIEMRNRSVKQKMEQLNELIAKAGELKKLRKKLKVSRNKPCNDE